MVFELSNSVSRMFSKRDGLSPDLEWMLQSDQVADEMIVRALVDDYYSSIYQLACSRLIYPRQAAQAAR